MKIAIFGSCITSTFANGATTFFRGLCKGLKQLGFEVTFLEEEHPESSAYRDLGEDPGYVHVVTYRADSSLVGAIEMASKCDLVVKFSECGTLDRRVEQALLYLRSSGRKIVFADGDAPVNLGTLARGHKQYLKSLIPQFDSVIVFAGGPNAARDYSLLGAKRVDFLFAGADPDVFGPCEPSNDLKCDMLFIGNRLTDREEKVRELFLRVAEQCPQHSFILAGAGWAESTLPANVKYLGHLPPSRLQTAYCSAKFVLNINRPAMASYGYSPPSRLFEAAACAACIVSDYWEGLESLFKPGKEIILANSPGKVQEILRYLDDETSRQIGKSARQRFLQDHTCVARAKELTTIFSSLVLDEAV